MGRKVFVAQLASLLLKSFPSPWKSTMVQAIAAITLAFLYLASALQSLHRVRREQKPQWVLFGVHVITPTGSMQNANAFLFRTGPMFKREDHCGSHGWESAVF